MTHLSFSNLRVFVNLRDHPIYTELTDRAIDKAEDVPFIKMPDLFISAACVGARENVYRESESKRKDIFVADAFDSRIQIPILFALAHKKINDLDKLSDPKAILHVCECWANGGIHIIHEQVKSGQGLRPLDKLIDFIIDDE